jgi:hypothetical protein
VIAGFRIGNRKTLATNENSRRIVQRLFLSKAGLQPIELCRDL